MVALGNKLHVLVLQKVLGALETLVKPWQCTVRKVGHCKVRCGGSCTLVMPVGVQGTSAEAMSSHAWSSGQQNALCSGHVCMYEPAARIL